MRICAQRSEAGVLLSRFMSAARGPTCRRAARCCTPRSLGAARGATCEAAEEPERL